MKNKKALVLSFIFLFFGIISIILYFLQKNNLINFNTEKLESISLNQNVVALKPNSNYQLSYYINPEYMNNEEVLFESSDTSIASVNSITGHINAKKEGKITITVRVKKYPNIKDECIVYVSNDDKKISTLAFNDKTINLQVGQSYQLKYQLEPDNATDYEIEFISSDENIVKIDSKGIIVSKKEGESIITIIDKVTNVKDTMKVIVKNEDNSTDSNEDNEIKVKEIVLDMTNISLKVNEKKQIIAKIYPEVNKKINWTSSDRSIATVDDFGNIIGLKKGEAIITASIDGVSKSVFLTVEEEKNKNEKTFTAVFESNILSCTTENQSCMVTAPSINKSGYEILGWSVNAGSKTAEIKVGEQISLTKNIEYYMVVRKKISANFILQDNNTTARGGNNSCYIYNNETSCNITSPILEGNNGYVAVGWNTNKNTTIASVNSNEIVSIKGNESFYSIVIKKNYLTVTFKVQDISAIKESTKEVTCEIINGNSCEVIVPNFTSNNGFTLIGWNTNKNESIANIKSGDRITIKSDMVYYSITKKNNPLVASFIIQNKTATKSNEDTSCILYNGNSSCKIVVPTLSGIGDNIVIGWNIDKNATTSTLNGGQTISLTKNITYYSITKSNKELIATFIIATNKLVSSSEENVTCNLYNGNNSCSVKTPNLTKLMDNVTPLGWNIDKNATKESVKANQNITINKDTTYYSVVSQLITVTFDVGENIEGKNIRADKLSYNYTDKNGNTVIKAEGKSLKATCLSYNGKGCTINEVPTIYSKGNFINGFSKTIGGDVINASQTSYSADTTLYAKCGYKNNIAVKKTNVGVEKIYGNVWVEVESGLSTSVANRFIEFLDIVYKYYPELFYFNGKITFYTENTYKTNLKDIYSNISKTSGLTFTNKDFSNVTLYYITYYPKWHLHTVIHEIGHAINYLYKRSTGTYVSETQDLIDLFNKYKTSNNRPLSSFVYDGTGRTEFVAEALAETMRILLYEKDGKYYYNKEGSLTDDIKKYIIEVLQNEHTYLKKKGKIK